jgi:type IV secretory pathway protease TraF
VKVLVVTSKPISADQLREALGPATVDAEVMVVAPALHTSATRFWVSDADEAIARAQAVQEETVERLDEAGVVAAGDTGESDPYEAIGDALATFPAERIVVFTRPPDSSGQRYREEIDDDELRERFGLPVDHAPVDGSPG